MNTFLRVTCISLALAASISADVSFTKDKTTIRDTAENRNDNNNELLFDPNDLDPNDLDLSDFDDNGAAGKFVCCLLLLTFRYKV